MNFSGTGLNNNYKRPDFGVFPVSVDNSTETVKIGEFFADEENTFVGEFAGNRIKNIQTNDFGIENAFYGAFAGDVVSTGDSNTIIGHKAGRILTTGNFNTLVGTSADVGGTSAGARTKTISLGYGANALFNRSFYLPTTVTNEAGFFDIEPYYGTADLTDFNSYDCSLKYNSETGQVVVKRGDEPKSLYQAITPTIVTPISLDAINQKVYGFAAVTAEGTCTVSFLYDNETPKFTSFKIYFAVDTIVSRILNIVPEENFVHGQITVLGSNTVFYGDGNGSAVDKGIITFRNHASLKIGGIYIFLAGSYIDFTLTPDGWSFEGILYNNQAINLGTLKTAMIT